MRNPLECEINIYLADLYSLETLEDPEKKGDNLDLMKRQLAFMRIDSINKIEMPPILPYPYKDSNIIRCAELLIELATCDDHKQRQSAYSRLLFKIEAMCEIAKFQSITYPIQVS